MPNEIKFQFIKILKGFVIFELALDYLTSSLCIWNCAFYNTEYYGWQSISVLHLFCIECNEWWPKDQRWLMHWKLQQNVPLWKHNLNFKSKVMYYFLVSFNILRSEAAFGHLKILGRWNLFEFGGHTNSGIFNFGMSNGQLISKADLCAIHW